MLNSNVPKPRSLTFPFIFYFNLVILLTASVFVPSFSVVSSVGVLSYCLYVYLYHVFICIFTVEWSNRTYTKK